MKKTLLATLVAIGFASQAQAVVIDVNTSIPDSNILINFNNTGLDWVYAGPIAPNEWGPGQIYPSSYRAAEGWRAATASEWANHPDWDDFIAPGNPGGIVSPSSFYNHNYYIFASEYWSDFYHVDAGDFAAGRVTDGVNGLLSGVPETIYVRNTHNSNNVPEPLSLALFASGLAGLRFTRRSKKG